MNKLVKGLVTGLNCNEQLPPVNSTVTNVKTVLCFTGFQVSRGCMQKERQNCDWCKEFLPVNPLKYSDGKRYHSCDGCLPYAEFDIRMFNSDEKRLQKISLQLQVA